MSSAEPSGSPRNRNRATIVTFYSYKGGVGRTMALANVAWVLADAGHRVLVVDWDLESPGLHRFLRPFLRDPELSSSTGVVEMVLEYGRAVEAATHDGLPTARLDELLERHTQMGNHADPLTYRFARPEGRVDFLGPGRQDSFYSRYVATFEWARFYQEQHGRRFTDALRENLRGDDYDYVLIDSRTGHSDNASLCTLVLPDVVVVGFNLSNQSIEGSAAVARQVREQSDGRIRVLPVPMRVEESDRERAERRRLRARDQFAGATGPILLGTEEQYWREVEVRHLANVAYEETLLPFALEKHEPSLQKLAYERLAQEITGDPSLRFAPVTAEDRGRYAREYAEVPVPRRTVQLVYEPRDRAWADWIRAELTANGVACEFPPPTAATPAGTDTTGDVLVLMSASMVSSARLTGLARRMPRQGGLNNRARIDVAWLEDVEVQPPFRDRPGPKLYTLEEEAARGALLAHFLPESRPPATWTDRAGRGPRFPGRRPQLWHVPLQRNATFLGREEYLRRLRNDLPPGRAAQPVVLHGPSGVGKRSYALEYTHRFAADYDAVWWMPAGSAGGIERELVLLSERLGAARRNSPRAVDALRDMLEDEESGPERLLLVYDDARHPDAVESLLINSPRVHVLITSECPDWGSPARRIEVEPPSADGAVRYLLHKTEDLSVDLAERLAGLVEPLPQMLDQMAAYLNSTGRPVAEAVADLERGIGTRLADGLDSPLAVWQTVVEDLNKEHPVSARLLRLMTRLSPDGVGWGLLESPAVLELLGLPGGEEGTRLLGFAVRGLTARSQARKSQNGKRLTAARIILAAQRQDLTPDEEREVAVGVRRALAAYSPPDEHVDDQAMDARYAELDAHVEPSGAVEDDDLDVRRWLVNQVRYRRRSQRLNSAFSLATTLEAAWTARSAGADPRGRLLLLRLRVELANTHTDAGRFTEANRINSAALAELRAVDGLDGAYTMRSALGRGGELRALGCPQEAVAEDHSTREVLRAKSGPDHHFTLMASSNFGLSLAMVGLTGDSLEVHREVYDRRVRVLGKRDPLTLRTSVHVGTRLRESGQLTASLTRLQDVYRLAGDEEGGFGWSDLTTLRASTALASTLRHIAVLDPGQTEDAARGKLDSARKCDLRAREGFEAYGGEPHPEALAARVGLAADLRLLGRTQQAMALAELNLAAYRSWGEDHLFARICEMNLALCLRDAELESAVELSERAWRGLRECLDIDPHHPFVLTASLNHANMLVFAGDSEAAHELDERTHEGLLRKYDADHPLARMVASHLGRRPDEPGPPGPGKRTGIELDIPSI
ncbi:FxSxx-COOH system tetratricopeptide repeat protein [Streptomyces sp. NPDC057363]|uniref:FxSxx-COOH system tetratricopeptide repeat protein n=1 Tax=Streptomyces sp. NPDC057363 TaxID=3346107 RepID=UPI0036332425